MADEPSERIVDQRVRNRIMEVVETLADGDGVREVGANEYFECYYDWIRHRSHGGMWPNGAITPAERSAVLEVSKLLDAACDSTPRDMTVEEFIGTGWPTRIQPVAQTALTLLRQRGRFSEDEEETLGSVEPPDA